MELMTLILITIFVAASIAEIRHCCFSCWFDEGYKLVKFIRTTLSITFYVVLLLILLSGDYGLIFHSIHYYSAYIILLLFFSAGIYINTRIAELLLETAYLKYIKKCVDKKATGQPLPPQPWKKFEDSPIYMPYLIQYNFDDYLKLLKIDPESMK